MVVHTLTLIHISGVGEKNAVARLQICQKEGAPGILQAEHQVDTAKIQRPKKVSSQK